LLWLGEGTAWAVSQLAVVQLSGLPMEPCSLQVNGLAMGRRVESWPICHAMSLLGGDAAGQDCKLPTAGRGSV